MEKIKVLLVDDEMDFLELMSVRIESWGYDLVKAKNGKEAVELVKSEKPDVVILDYLLPDMDGIAVLREIRKFNEKIPVIVFTAYPDTKAIQVAGKLGIAAFIPKLSAHSEVLPLLKAAIDMTVKKLSKK